MVPELVMVALGRREWIPCATKPLDVMVPELVMVALAPLELIPRPARPVRQIRNEGRAVAELS